VSCYATSSFLEREKEFASLAARWVQFLLGGFWKVLVLPTVE
jgi:hypothetical protein